MIARRRALVVVVVFVLSFFHPLPLLDDHRRSTVLSLEILFLNYSTDAAHAWLFLRFSWTFIYSFRTNKKKQPQRNKRELACARLSKAEEPIVMNRCEMENYSKIQDFVDR
jgi:hypothetical protein